MDVETVALPDAQSFGPTATAWAKTVNLLDAAGLPIAPPVDASQVLAGSESVEDVLNKLRYSRLTIDSFSTNTISLEQGASATVTVNWTLNRDPTSQTINGVAVANNLRTANVPAVAAGQVITLNAQDSADPNGAVNLTQSLTIGTKLRRYWGASSSTALNSAGVIGLTGFDFENTKVGQFVVTTTGASGQYVYFAYPQTLGDPLLYKLFGFNDDYVKTVVAVTTPTGAVVSYIVLRSTNMLIGTVPIEVM